MSTYRNLNHNFGKLKLDPNVTQFDFLLVKPQEQYKYVSIENKIILSPMLNQNGYVGLRAV